MGTIDIYEKIGGVEVQIVGDYFVLEDYGADIDGNRGIRMIELEDVRVLVKDVEITHILSETCRDKAAEFIETAIENTL